jgi:hypothetical protein
MDETSHRVITNVMEEHHILDEKVAGTCAWTLPEPKFAGLQLTSGVVKRFAESRRSGRRSPWNASTS